METCERGIELNRMRSDLWSHVKYAAFYCCAATTAFNDRRALYDDGFMTSYAHESDRVDIQWVPAHCYGTH